MGCVARAVAARAVFATVVSQVRVGDILKGMAGKHYSTQVHQSPG